MSVCCEPCCYLLCWAQSWVEMEFLANQLSYLKSTSEEVCGWMRGWLLTPVACGMLSSPDRWNMSTVKAHKVFLGGDTSAFCRSLPELLTWNHSIAPGTKRWCCYYEKEEKKCIPVSSGSLMISWGPGGELRALLFLAGNAILLGFLSVGQLVLVGRARESNKTRRKNTHLEGGEGRKILKEVTGFHLVRHQTESETGEGWQLMLGWALQGTRPITCCARSQPRSCCSS